MKVRFIHKNETLTIDLPKSTWFWIAYEGLIDGMYDGCIKFSPWIVYLYCVVLNDLMK